MRLEPGWDSGKDRETPRLVHRSLPWAVSDPESCLSERVSVRRKWIQGDRVEGCMSGSEGGWGGGGVCRGDGPLGSGRPVGVPELSFLSFPTTPVPGPFPTPAPATSSVCPFRSLWVPLCHCHVLLVSSRSVSVCLTLSLPSRLRPRLLAHSLPSVVLSVCVSLGLRSVSLSSSLSSLSVSLSPSLSFPGSLSPLCLCLSTSSVSSFVSPPL